MRHLILLCLLSISSLFSLSSISQDLYNINNITILELTFEETNWDEILDQYYAAGNEERLLAMVVINGTKFDSVGVRYKGSSTYSADNVKNPLNIKLNYVIDQHYQGFTKLKLSNGNHDPSFLREVLSYEIARKYMVAPLSNYTKVYVNGSYHGLYTSSESINGDFGERYLFAGGDNTRIKGNSDMAGPEGESSLNYLGPDSSLYYSHYELKSDYGWMDLVELTDVLNNQPEEIDNLLDMDRVIWMLAFNNVCVNLDSYSGRKGNFYLMQNDDGIINIIPWDLNMSLGGFETIGGGPPAPGNLNDLIELSPMQEDGNSGYPLIKLVLENDHYKKNYIAHCRTILEENFTYGWYVTRGFELQEFIAEACQTDPNAIYDFTSFLNNMTITVPSTGPPPAGSKGAFGITELFEARVNFLQNHEEYQHTPPTISDIVTAPKVVPDFSTATVTASVSNANNVLLGYRHSLSSEFSKTAMFDDGTHNDGTAGDGVYGVEISINSTDIQYYIYAENDSAGIYAPERAEHEFYEIEVIASISDVVINELMADNDFEVNIYPNPASDWLKIAVNKEKSFRFEVYNCYGSSIYKGIVEHETKLPISSWPSGLYVLKIAGKGYRFLVFRDKIK